MARTTTAEAILTLATEIREGNTQLITWLQQSSERQERQNQATIVALHEISKGQEHLMQGQERIGQGQERIAQGQEKIAQGQERIAQGQERIAQGQERLMQTATDSTRALATMLLESQALTARMLELTRDIHTRTTGGSDTKH